METIGRSNNNFKQDSKSETVYFWKFSLYSRAKTLRLDGEVVLFGAREQN